MIMNSPFDRTKKQPTLDQINVFLAVVEAGGFSAAARRLHRQQSSVSYTIAAFEAQLGGVALFDRTVRRPVLTEIGRAVLIDARRIAQEVDGLNARMDGLLAGVEPKLSIVVDAMLPGPALVATLRDLRTEFPKLAVQLRTEVLGGVPAAVLDGSANIGISGPLFYRIDRLDQVRIGQTSLIPVCAPNHELAKMPGPISNRQARAFTQLVLTDRSEMSKGQDFAVLSPDTIRVSDIQAKYWLALSGLGWGNLPLCLIKDDLAAGRLHEVKLAEWHRRPYPFHTVHSIDAPPGPAALRFAEYLERHLTED